MPDRTEATPIVLNQDDARYGFLCCFFFQAEDGIRDTSVTGVQTCALPISRAAPPPAPYAPARRAPESAQGQRSEERRVGKECRSRWTPQPKKKLSKK